jgi:hypothetical protein
MIIKSMIVNVYSTGHWESLLSKQEEEEEYLIFEWKRVFYFPLL